MANVTLKKAMKEAQAFSDDSNGRASSLYDLLASLAGNPSFEIKGVQANIATGIVASGFTTKATRIRKVWARAAVCGSAGATNVQVLVNGTVQASCTLNIDNADTDGVLKTATPDVAVPAGARIDINISAAPTGGTGLTVQVDCNPIDGQCSDDT